MRTTEYATTTHVPAFLTKLWKLVTDVSCDDLISWNSSGTSFIIYDEIRFSKELLPMYFKHNNMASFVRQLNMYGFRKLSTVDQGGMHCFKNEIEFRHQFFIRGREECLELIKRKIPNSKSDEPRVKQEYIDDLMSNIKSLKGKQETADKDLKSLRKENLALWNHVGALTHRYHKQQAVLQQLVPFFMNMVQSSREVALKRKVPLMIDEGDMSAKMARLSPPYYVESSDQDQTTSIPSSPGNVTNRGPVIHDVTELESSKMFPGNILYSPNTSPKEIEAIIDSPVSCSLESSEQTNDSPFTDSSSVETLNILNHTFERSSSLSPHMDLKHSPASSRSPMHLSPQMCATPTSPTPSYSHVSNGIPPLPVIDETTRDVPLSSNLVMNPFVPKIEDTCSESNLYTVDPIINERVSMLSSEPSITNEMATSIMVGEGASSVMNGNTILKEGSSSSVLNGNTVLREGSPSSGLNGNSVMSEGSSPLVVPNRSNAMRERSLSMGSRSTFVRDGSSSFALRSRIMRDGSSTVLNGNPVIREQTSTIMNQNAGAPFLLNSNAMIREGTSSAANEAINENTSGNRQNKISPSFPSSSKSTSEDEQWMLSQINQDASGSNIENWLGQIFIVDKLVAGCSLPQKSN